MTVAVQSGLSDKFYQLSQTKGVRAVSYVAMLAVTFVLFALWQDASALETDALANGSAGEEQGGGVAGEGIEIGGAGTMILAEPVMWLLNFMNGTGGLLAALLGLLMTLYSAFVSKSLVGVLVSVGIALCALYGPDILINFFGAVI
jgi:hypothetical protein